MLNELSPIANGDRSAAPAAVGRVDVIAGAVVLDPASESPRSLEVHAATIFRTEVKGDRGLPFPMFRRAAVGRWNATSGVRGSGAVRCGVAGSLGGGGGGAATNFVDCFRGDDGRSLVGDSEREERDDVMEGIAE